MCSMLFAESAVLVHFKSVGIIFLILHGIVVSLLAFAACKCDLNSHIGTSVLILYSLPLAREPGINGVLPIKKDPERYR